MRIGEEARRVRLDLRNREPSTSIGNIIRAFNTSGERTGETSRAVTHGVVASGVGEGDTRRARAADGSFVDVCCGVGWGAVVAGYAVEGDVIADGVGLAVDGVVELTTGAGLTGCCDVGAIDDLGWGGSDVVDGGELLGGGGADEGEESCGVLHGEGNDMIIRATVFLMIEMSNEANDNDFCVRDEERKRKGGMKENRSRYRKCLEGS